MLKPLEKSQPKEWKPFQTMRAQKFGRYSFLILALVISVVFFYMIRSFILPVILAAVFAGLFYPSYKWLLRVSHNRRNVSSFICCLVLLLGLLIPAYLVSNLVAREAATFFRSAEATITRLAEQEGSWGYRLKRHPWVRRLYLDKLAAQLPVEEVAKQGASLLGTVINRASRETFELVTTLFLSFFVMFYFFRDGRILLTRLKYLSPLPEVIEEELIRRFLAVSRATIKGTLLTGLLKGTLGGITLWAFGIPAPALWGVVMVFLSVLPVVGAYIVMYPAAIVLLVQGQIWQGVALFLIAAVVIGSLDNVLEPVLVARDAGMHNLMVFFAMLGGIGMFGVTGFIVGPIIAALFLTVLEVYAIGFKRQLDWIHHRAVAE